MALSWLVFTMCFVTHIQAQQLSYLKEQIPITEASIKAVNAKGDIPPGSITGIIPPRLLPFPCFQAVNQSKVDDVINWYKSSQEELEYAKSELEKLDPTPAQVDWKVSLYQLIVNQIVNFRDANDPPGLPVNDTWIKPAADVFGLNYIPFTDLSFVQHPLYEHSGPSCGVFVSRGDKPFMILSFKGTSNPLDAATDFKSVPTTQSDGSLYNQAVHQGVYDGLFDTFYPMMEEPAIDIIWKELDRVAKDLLGGTEGTPVPLYVSGHSLGAGYAQLAYVEIFRRLDALDVGKAFRLKSLYAFGALRVAAILGYGFAHKVNDIFKDREQPIFLYSTEHDVVPFVPGIVTYRGLSGEPDDNIVASGWVHLDGEHILHRDRAGSSGKYFTNEAIERGGLPKGDPDGHSSWDYHVHKEYYNSIKKIIDPSFDTPWPPPPREYPDSGGNCP